MVGTVQWCGGYGDFVGLMADGQFFKRLLAFRRKRVYA